MVGANDPRLREVPVELRLRSLLVAPLTAVVLFSAACGGSAADETGGADASQTAAAASPTRSDTATASTSPTSPSATATPPSERLPTFRVVGGEVEGPRRVRVKVGHRVEFTVHSDTADEVHVHTYDVAVPVRPGRPAVVRFRADIPGVFEVELERAHQPVTQLRVTP